MPKFAHGNMWDSFRNADLFCITANSTIKKNGALVMGRGIAKEARDYFPKFDKRLGQEICDAGAQNGLYHLLVSPHWPTTRLALFQVKTYFGAAADPSIIAGSTKELIAFIAEHPLINVSLNFPGTGNGKLPICVVYRIIKHLPDNVTVWTKEPIDLSIC